MDIFELIENDFDDFFDEAEEAMVQPRRPRQIRPRIDYTTYYDDVDFRVRFRLTKEAVNHLMELIKDSIVPDTNRNNCISPMSRLLLTLRYYATGCFLVTIADFSGVSKSSASRIIPKVSRAIASLRPMYVKFPSDITVIHEGYYAIASFPKVAATIDCTHILIKSPGGDDAEYHRNRKGKFSLNVQTVIGPDLKILDIVARWPGSTHDQIIFDNSLIKQRFLNKEFGESFLLGDSGYGNNSYCLTPLHSPTTAAEKLYNESQIRTRNAIERSYGVWKSRFPVLMKTITLDYSSVQSIIVACAVLHNIAIDLKENPFEPVREEVIEGEEPENEVDNNDNNVRNKLINEYFASLLE